MTPVSLNKSTTPEAYAPVLSQKPGSPAAQASGEPPDNVQLSPAALREVALTGRVAINAAAGNVTSEQTQQLYSQLSAIHQQISSADAQAIQQSQNQLRATIYSDAHNGAAPPTDPNVPRAVTRQALEAGRIALNEKAGT